MRGPQVSDTNLKRKYLEMEKASTSKKKALEANKLLVESGAQLMDFKTQLGALKRVRVVWRRRKCHGQRVSNVSSSLEASKHE